MKYIKSYILFVLMVFTVTGCTLDDLKDDVNNLKDRVTLIEEQVKLLNDNLAVIGYILDPQNKTVSKVETVTEGGVEKYIITLSDDRQLSLVIGKEGTVNEPEITIGEDGKWYINGNPTGIVAVGEDGKNGEGYPEFRVENGNWQVRFGDGAWANVPGGEGIAGGSSLGDQIFESAKVDGNNFVVTLKDGSIHTLPIVATLVCVIDKSALDDEGFLVINKGERVIVPVKIEGENSQVTCPQGWRATLNKLDVADEQGNNYQLSIFAPATDVKALTRAMADNTTDVTVQVQKGAFWAVDKIKVKNPKDYSNNLNKYEDGLVVTVGGLEIKKDVYGAATEITSDQAISEGGVYFVSTNNVTLTYALGNTGVDNLIIIPTTMDVTTINLEVNSQLFFSGAFICQNVNLSNKVTNQYPLRVKGSTAKIGFDKCKIKGLLIGKGLVMPNQAGVDNIDSFEMRQSDVAVESGGAGMNLIQDMNCSLLTFENNIVYYSEDVPQTQDYTGHMTNFKVFNGQKRTLDNLVMNSNTFVDVETTGTSGVTGFVWSAGINKLTVNKNLYWQSYPATTFGTAKVTSTTVLLRGVLKTSEAVAMENYGYNGNPDMKTFHMCFGNERLDTMSELEIVEGLFDITNPASFNKSTGIFIPKDGYTQYGAQR